jgi:twinkle protein
MSADLMGLLLDRGIRLKSVGPGRSEQVICPRCGGGRTRERSLSVKIDDDGLGAVWQCHRGKCDGNTGSVRVSSEDDWQPRARAQKAKPLPKQPLGAEEFRPDWFWDFWSARKIGARVIKQFGVHAAKRWFRDLGEQDAIVFPYHHGNEVVARKYRHHPDKHPMNQENTGVPTLYNANALPDANWIIWVEGEPDVLAMAECGFANAVSLRDGAPQDAKYRADDKRFAALATHEKELALVGKFILAGDNDPPGLALREELARRLGRHKVALVTWPEGCKDAGDVLERHGPDVVAEAIATAEPYPIDGLVRVHPDILNGYREKPRPILTSTGTRNTDLILRLPGEGRLIVVTGFPSHGKTSWVRFVMVHLMRQSGRKWLVFSPEHLPMEDFITECAEVYVGQPYWADQAHTAMTTAEERSAAEFFSERLTMLNCDSLTEQPTLDWLLERAEAAVLRDGITDFQLDPWNEIAHQRGEMTETDYTGQSLQKLKAFAYRHGVNIWVVAHPAKPAPGDNDKPPGGYSISGSQHWNNKADLGLTVWVKPNTNDVELHVWKSRFRRWARRGDHAKLNFDQASGRYSDRMASRDPPPARGFGGRDD